MSSDVKVPLNFYQVVKWASIIIIIGGIKLSTPIVLPLFIALFLSITLSFPINFLVTKKVPRNLATIIILVAFGGSVYLIGDIIGKSSSEFISNLPQY